MRPVPLYLAKAESEFKAKRFESAMATLEYRPFWPDINEMKARSG